MMRVALLDASEAVDAAARAIADDDEVAAGLDGEAIGAPLILRAVIVADGIRRRRPAGIGVRQMAIMPARPAVGVMVLGERQIAAGIAARDGVARLQKTMDFDS